MLLQIAYYGASILRQKTKPILQIDDEIRKLAADMIETMHANNGIGLAAPQVFCDLAIFVTCIPIEGPDGKWIDGTDLVYINPKILSYSSQFATTKEGCISLPKLYLPVSRPVEVTIQAINLEGELFEATFSGLQATNFMHENDHLNGVLTIDRIDRKERARIEPFLREIKKQHKNKK